MKTLFNTVSENFEAKNESTVVNECVVAARRLQLSDGKAERNYVLMKHRDRSYKPSLSIIHTVVNGMEMAYLRDDTTLWSEGINAAGIAIINSALSVEDDENMEKLVKKADTAPKFSKDGERILKALTMNNIDDAVFFAKNYKSGIQGHTIISDGDDVYTIELTSSHTPVITKLDGLDTIVRTNHGVLHASAGYQDGLSKKSSETRLQKATEFLDASNTPEEMLVNMRKQPYNKKSQLNPLRSTNTLSTSSQLLLNPAKKAMHLVIIKSQVDSFKGIINQLPAGFEPTLQITFEEV